MTNNKKVAWIKWLLRGLLLGAFLLGGYLLFNTEEGLEITISLLKEFLPGQLKINQFQGKLIGPIQLKELYYKNKKINLYISKVQFDWQWKDLFEGKLNFGPVFIDKLNFLITQKTSPKKLTSYQNKTFLLPKIFRYLKFDSIDIHQIDAKSEGINFLLKGSIYQQWNINWQINIKNLNKFIPELQGKIVFQGKIRGARAYPKLDLTTDKTNLLWKNWQFKQIQAAIDLDSENKKWIFKLVSAQFNNKTFELSPIQLNLSGSLLPFSLEGNLSEVKINNLTKLEPPSIVIPIMKISSHLSKHGLEASLQTYPANKNQLFFYLLLPRFQLHSIQTLQQALYVNIDLNFKDLNFLTQLIPDLKKPKGIFNAQIKIKGSLNKPTFNLNLNLLKASTIIPDLGLNLKNINYQIHTDKNNFIGSGQFYSGNGFLELHTVTDLLNKNLSTLIDIRGKDITIIHNSKYQIIASPKLKVLANLHQIQTEGTILFPKANIKINPKNNNLAQLSKDVVFVGAKKKTINFPLTFKNDIKIETGDNIQLQYQGLITKLKGTLTLRQDFDHPILATGQLKLFPGEYNYYGQSLTLKPNSSLNFVNTPFNDPGLDITASRKILILPVFGTNSKFGSSNFIESSLLPSQSTPIQLEVGLHVQGTLQDPHVLLFANPSKLVKSQLDLLSYLITGQSSTQLNAASMQLLLSAASNLGGEKNNIGKFISKFQQKLGLDQLTVGAKPIFDPTTNSLQQNTSLIVGKNLSPKLNISYSLGLQSQISILELNYLLNKNFSLRTTSSNFDKGLDLIYKLEKH